jgi:succinate-semialdehyde dehydrogenase / glutarate-semialdehyde dehydrogenase
MTKLISTNPAKNYEVIGSVDISTDTEIKEKVAKANAAKIAWKEIGLKERMRILEKAYANFEKRKDEIAELITKEIGKPILESRGEVKSYDKHMQWFSDNAEAILSDEITYEDDKSINRIAYEPIGTTTVITPWNFPLNMFFWGVFPNLLVGNTVVFKISEECPLVGKIIEEVMNDSEFPEGVFSEVYGNGEVGQNLVEQNIDLVWFTGSTKTGKQLYKIAGEKFIKALLEMGGSSPAVLFEDIDIDDVVPEVYLERFRNCGQVCDSLKRLIVHESIFEKVVSKLKEEIEEKKVGDPMDEKTDVGSLVAKRQVDLIESQVADAVEKGAKIIIGGKRPNNLEGAFYEPTILTDVTKDMRVWTEEVFGPVFPVVTFKTDEEAVALANDTCYGLGSRVYSKDLERARRVARKIEAGTVEINHGNRWLPCNPFGGYKDSGMGREHGKAGLYELCQIKVISEDKI